MSKRHRTTACVFLAAACSVAASASGTVAWEMNSYSDFIRGRFQGLSLSRDGRLSLAPKLDTIFTGGEPVIWSVVRGPAGELYAATGHRGRVYRIDRGGKSELIWNSEQPEVFALAIGKDGALYAGSSPGGKVWRIVGKKATEYFDPGARYIWALAAGTDGALYVGTGDKGKVFRVESAGKGSVWYETGQSHVTGLALDGQGRLLAGTEPNGILYRVSGKDKAFVLYDSTLPEIRSIVPMPDGTGYAAALGGSLAGRAGAAAQAGQGGAGAGAVSSSPTTITVEAQNMQPGAEIKPPQPDAAKQQQQANAAAAAQVTTQFTPVVDMSGVEKSAVYRINPDNTVETLWTSKEENVYDLLALEKQILFATDVSGRIYGLAPDRRITLVAQTNEGETTRLLPDENAVLAATGDMGRIYRLDESAGNAGSYESPVHDAGTAARWGSLSWRADVPAGATLRFRTRSGNSARPDRTWSDWSEPVGAAAGSPITSPNARYIAWKLEVTGSNGSSPLLNSVTLAYLPQNSPPVVRSINVITQAAAISQAVKPASTQASNAPYNVTVSDTGDASASGSAGTPTQTLTRASTQQVTVTWQAEDPDGDRLVYNIYFRGDDESQWKLLRGSMRENSITFDSDVFADGKYFYRVVASDKEANPPASAREAQLLSSPVMIDNTPPGVAIRQVQPVGSGKWRVDFDAADSASPLRRCEYSLDASSWVPVEASDGVIDSLREKFTLELTGIAPGEHLLVIRAADSANNTGLAKTILK
jgi:hypothetical protein